MRKKATCRDSRIQITKVKRSYKTSSGFRYTEEIGLFSSDKSDVVCPRCLSEDIRKYGKSDPITRWDLLQKGKGVGRVTLQSQLWACRNCRNWKFLDPHFPYADNKTTTPDFDHWVAQQLIDHPETYQQELASRFDLPVSTINRIIHNKLKGAENCVMCAVPVKTIWIVKFHYLKFDCLLAVGQGITDWEFCQRNNLNPDSYVLLGISKGLSISNLKDTARLVITEPLERIYCPQDLISPQLTNLCETIPYNAEREPDVLTQLMIEIKRLHNQRVAFDKLLIYLLHNEQARIEEPHFQSYGKFSEDCYTSFVCHCLTGKQANYSFSDLAHWADLGVRYFCIDIGRLLDTIQVKPKKATSKQKARE